MPPVAAPWPPAPAATAGEPGLLLLALGVADPPLLLLTDACCRGEGCRTCCCCCWGVGVLRAGAAHDWGGGAAAGSSARLRPLHCNRQNTTQLKTVLM
jgi:hypothetical protein